MKTVHTKLLVNEVDNPIDNVIITIRDTNPQDLMNNPKYSDNGIDNVFFKSIRQLTRNIIKYAANIVNDVVNNEYLAKESNSIAIMNNLISE